MALYDNVAEAIGNTPMIKLNSVVPKGSCVYAKMESHNPGGSIKDRPALAMIRDAESKGLLKKGGTIIEPTSGNMGIAIAMIAAVRGYKTILVMPDTMSKERMAYMKAYGAELVLTPGNLGMKGSVNKAEELSKETGGIVLRQFDNPSNPASHRVTTGKEILKDLPDVDYVIGGFGTGGTVTGIANTLRDAGSRAKVIGVEPAESPLVTEGKAGPHKIQGIGANFVPGNLDTSLIHEVVTVEGDKAIEMTCRLAREEGIFAGISSGAATYAAIKLAEKEPGKKIVVILPDGGDKYISMGIFD